MSATPGSGLGASAVRRRFLLLLVVASVAALLCMTNGDWALLVNGGRSLIHGGGLHTYARWPVLQAGPPSLLLAAGLAATGATAGRILMHSLLIACALVALICAERAARRSHEWQQTPRAAAPGALTVGGLMALVALCRLGYVSGANLFLLPLGIGAAAAGCWVIACRRRDQTVRVDAVAVRTLLVGLPALVAWGSLAGGGHIDDGLAMMALAAAMYAMAASAPLSTGVLLGLAVALKPWAIVGWPMLFGLPRAKAMPAVIAVTVPAVCWLPFVLADPHTLNAASHGFSIGTGATVSLLGLHGATAPPWLRSAELALALVTALVAGRRQGWASAVPAGMVARLLLDPATFAYYTSSTVLACAMGDVQTRRRPWRTAVIWCGLWLAPAFLPASIDAWVRALTLLVVTGSYVVPRFARRRDDPPSQASPDRARADGWLASESPFGSPIPTSA